MDEKQKSERDEKMYNLSPKWTFNLELLILSPELFHLARNLSSKAKYY